MNPSWHRIGERGEVLAVSAKLLPGLGDLLGELAQVAAGGHLGDDLVETCPAIFNRIAISRLADPIKDGDIVLAEPLLDAAGGVAWGSILHEDKAPSHLEAPPQIIPQDVLVHGGIHLLIGGDKVDADDLPVADCRPDHKLGRMLH